MKTFTVTTEGENRLGLRELCQRYVDKQWLAAHMTDEQAAESLLDQFKRMVRAELVLLTVEARSNTNSPSGSDGRAIAFAPRPTIQEWPRRIWPALYQINTRL